MTLVAQKQCKDCKQLLSVACFRVTKSRYTQPYCSICERIRGRKYYADNRDKMRTQLRHKARRLAYGISEKEFTELLSQQANSCAICGTDTAGGKGNWHVDHCHSTGKVRGLLCHKCNTGIGLLNDDPELLRKAVVYLEK